MRSLVCSVQYMVPCVQYAVSSMRSGVCGVWYAVSYHGLLYAVSSMQCPVYGSLCPVCGVQYALSSMQCSVCGLWSLSPVCGL